METRVLQTSKAPQAIGPYSQAIKAGDFVYISGQLPVDPVTGKMVETVENQTRQVMRNIHAIIKAIDPEMDYDDIVKTTIFLKNFADFKTVNEAYGGFFKEKYPARSTFEVGRLPLDACVEIESIVYKKEKGPTP
jgi:2-iminobutanoate/2-iminopropanoate deaminase